MATDAQIKDVEAAIAHAAKMIAKCDDPADAERWQGIANQQNAILATLRS